THTHISGNDSFFLGAPISGTRRPSGDGPGVVDHLVCPRQSVRPSHRDLSHVVILPISNLDLDIAGVPGLLDRQKEEPEEAEEKEDDRTDDGPAGHEALRPRDITHRPD